jgi:isoleucyl-tRNA synthetase
MYKLPSGELNLAELQKKVLEKWKKESTFKKSIEFRGKENEFVFYDGPPFANGLPHYGHLLTSYIKDSVARFQTTIGRRTERRFGWDCHGLPAEMETEKELKVSGRTSITEYGIDKFNDACRSSVMKYSKQWQEYIEKAGRWVDFEEDYKTMDTPYMESVLWGFTELYKKGLIYEDFRVVPYSWKCETPLSNFETKMDNSYRSHTSKTATVKFKLNTSKNFASGLNVYALIWTTTPWTLPSNLSLAVNKNIEYVVLKVSENEGVLLAKNLASKYEKELGKNILLEVKGEDLVGMSYTPLFDFFQSKENAFKIIHGDFVEDAEGTGIVHLAPGFGEDDWQACKNNNISIVCPVDDGGRFTGDLYDTILPYTERLEFENLTEEHNSLIQELLSSHPEMHFDGAEKSFEFYKKHREKFGVAPMVIKKRDTKEIIGIGGILAHSENKPLKDENAEVLCFLKDKFQGFGFGGEAFKHFTKLAFVRFGVKEVCAVIFKENQNSIKMLNKIGFTSKANIIDARSGFEVAKLSTSFYPSHFKQGGLEFKNEGSLPSNFKYKPTQNTYYIYKEGAFVGAIDITENILSYEFTQKEIEETAIKEMLDRFALDAITADFPLKNFGFFESKPVFKRLSTVLKLSGRQVFDANDDIIHFLKQSGLLVKQEQYIHNYPHCWRTDTPLIYKAVSSWYVGVSTFKDRMVELNKQINWMPSHIRDGQFGKWLENARDWSITRNRFWGTPVPVWKVVNKKTGLEVLPAVLNSSLNEFVKIHQNPLKNEFLNIKVKFDDGGEFFFSHINHLQKALQDGTLNGNTIANITYRRTFVFGSIKELEEFFGTQIKDLHRPFIDNLKITDPKNKECEIVRVTDVLDCWFESGSMPFASVHYPFENKDWFETHNPADFIVEYVAQTRGWFYTLMVLSTAIFDRIPFKNCLCHGVILDENGQKLSKRLRNYPDPLEVFDTFGSDAMRFFLLSSSVVMGGDLNISKDGAEIREVIRLVIKPIWNAYTFFAMYANADGIKAEYSVKSQDVMDVYILSKLQAFSSKMKLELEGYNFPEACNEIESFLDVLNNWYIRRNKDRFWKEEKDESKISAYNTLWTVLFEFSKIISSILPFTAESLFQHLQE